MADLSTIQVSDPVSADSINRLKQAIQQTFADIGAPTSASVTVLKTTPSVSTYTVKTSDQMVVVDASGGPFTVSLPVPKTKQVVTVVVSAQSIVVKRADGQPINGHPFVLLVTTGTRASTFVCTGSDWVRA